MADVDQATNSETNQSEIGLRFRKAVPELLLMLTAGIAALVGFWWKTGYSLKDLDGLWGKGDHLFIYGVAKALNENTWLTSNSSLGFPLTQDWSHFPAGNAAYLFQLKVLMAFGLSPVAAVNFALILTFPLTAAAMFIALRMLHVDRVIALASSVVFALLPWHVERLGHTQLVSTWAVAAGLIWLALVSGVLPFAKHVSRRTLTVIAIPCALLVGLVDAYYLAFFLILGVVGFIWSWARREQPTVGVAYRLGMLILPLVAFGTYMLATRLAALGPSVGLGNTRQVGEQLYYGGFLLSLFVSQSGSVLSEVWPNSILSSTVAEFASGEGNALYNLMLALASIATAVVLLNSSLRPGLRSDRDSRSTAVSIWSGFWLVSVAFFTVTGFGIAVGALATSQFRSWGRMAIVSAALALVVFSLLLTRLRAKYIGESPKTEWRRPAAIAALAVLLGVLVLDAFGPRGYFESDDTTQRELQTMMLTASERLEDDCPILNQPMTGFPESNDVGGMGTYDPLLVYLASEKHRFSYGAISSQIGSNWWLRLSYDPTELARQAHSIGFCAILVDTAASEDPAGTVSAFTIAAGEPIASAMDRWYLFSLEGAPTDPNDGLILTTPEVRFGVGFGDQEVDDSWVISRWTIADEADLQITNPGGSPITKSLSFEATAPGCVASAPIRITSPGAEDIEFELAAGETREITLALDIPAKDYVPVSVGSIPDACFQTAKGKSVGVKVRNARVE